MISFILHDGAQLPKRGSAQAAGLDIHCIEKILIEPYSQQLVYTGVQLANCPDDIYLRVASRSKLANKRGLHVNGGVVDSDYRGKIGVILYNHTSQPVELPAQSAIAQLIPEAILAYEAQEVFDVVDTERGEAGVNCKEERLAGAEPAPEPEDLCLFCDKDYFFCNAKSRKTLGNTIKVVECPDQVTPF